MRLALVESKMCLVHVLKRYRFHRDPGHQVSVLAIKEPKLIRIVYLQLDFTTDQVLISPKHVELRLEKRKEVDIPTIPQLKRTISRHTKNNKKKLTRQFTW